MLERDAWILIFPHVWSSFTSKYFATNGSTGASIRESGCVQSQVLKGWFGRLSGSTSIPVFNMALRIVIGFRMHAPLDDFERSALGFEPSGTFSQSWTGTFSPPNPPSFPAAVLAADVRSLLLRVTENPIWDRHFSADAGWKVRFFGFG